MICIVTEVTGVMNALCVYSRFHSQRLLTKLFLCSQDNGAGEILATLRLQLYSDSYGVKCVRLMAIVAITLRAQQRGRFTAS